MNAAVVLFDLFGTVVHFAPRVPPANAAPSTWRTAMEWLRETAQLEIPEVRFEDFLSALMHVTEAVIQQRPPEYFEVPSGERFRRALVAAGVDASRAPGLAERLSLAHMTFLASTTHVPPDHYDVLQALAAHYRLGLISNFDHGPTARQLLARHNLARFFEVVLISDGFGRRKPHPAIFHAALDALGVSPHAAVYVGDSVSDDLIGAANARIAAVWVNPKGTPLPPDVLPPYAEIRALRNLPDVLV